MVTPILTSLLFFHSLKMEQNMFMWNIILYFMGEVKMLSVWLAFVGLVCV